MKLTLSLLLLFYGYSIHAQNLQVSHRTQDKQVAIKLRKIQSVVTIDGLFHEGKPKMTAEGLVFRVAVVPFDEIGILEVKKLSTKQVASFPLKLIGLITGGAGVIMSTAYLADEEETDAIVGATGLTLIGVGTGALVLGKKTSAQSSDDKIKSFHVREWAFGYGSNP